MFYLRPYKECDSEIIVKWITSEKAFYQWSANRLGAYPPSNQLLNDFKKTNEMDDTVFQVTACNDEGPVGFLNMRFLGEKKRAVRFGFIIVNDKLRGMGYGRKMIRLALRYAFEMLKVERVTLGVFENNPKAYQCYKACGFKEVSTEKPNIYDIMGEQWVNIEMMASSVNDTEENNQEETIPEEVIVNEIINRNQFHYAYQPIVSAKTGEIYGYEALMRAELDTPISPLTILDCAKHSNRLYDIEKSTFFNVCKEIKECKEQFGNKKVFINSIPGNLLKEDDYLELDEQYHEYFSHIFVEITEATELSDQDIYVLLRRSRKSGFSVAIDDYGTGYSNTTNLLRYLPNCVKVDRLLITNIHQDSKKQHFVKGIVAFARENGFMVLAEGVETAAELRCVIQMGVDLIQGYYTAKPNFEIIPDIDERIKHEIINANVIGQNQFDRKIYVVTEENELPLMRIALEQYTGIVIAKSDFTLVGNSNYIASLNVKIKDGTRCTLHLKDVMLESFSDFPCIELGENVNLTLFLEGDILLRKFGICVPASSELRVVGPGNMTIPVKSMDSYGIGNAWDAQVGDIHWSGSGKLDIQVDAINGIAIGGGKFGGKKGIHIMSGETKIELASARSIGIGCVSGDMPISLHDCNVQFVLNTENGTAIGCIDEIAHVKICDSKVTIDGNGNNITGIGGAQDKGANILLQNAKIYSEMNGQHLCLMGSPNGPVEVRADRSDLKLIGKGSQVIGIGSETHEGMLEMKDSKLGISIRSAEPTIFGLPEDRIRFEGGTQEIIENE